MRGGWRITGFQLAATSCAALLAASVQAAPPAPGGLAPRAPQVMLYFSHNLGGGAGSVFGKPTFGLRVQQIRQAGNSGDPEAMNDPLSHRELIDWQLQGRSNLRVSLGHRLSYDVSNRTFGKPERRPIMAFAAPHLRNGATTGGGLMPVMGNAATGNVATSNASMRNAGMGNATIRDSFNRADSRMAAFPSSAFREQGVRDSGSLHEIAAAAVAALNPAHFAAQARLPAPRAGVAALRASTGQLRANN